MRLPFLQMESDLLAHGAPQVSALAGCTPVQALGHIAFLRAWAVAQATDEAPPDGWARGPDAADAIEAAAQWGGEAGRLLRALRVAKLVEVTSEGVRVLGLEPYVLAWNKNAKAKERMANARARSANVRGTYSEQASTDDERTAKFGRQMQTQMEDVEAEEKTASQVAASAAPGASATEMLALALGNLPAPEEAARKPSKRKSPADKPEPRGDPRHAPLIEALVDAHREAKGAPYAFAGGKDAKGVSDLLALADQDPATAGDAAPAEILRRWGIALEWVGFPACTGLLSFRDNWNAYVRKQAGAVGTAAQEDRLRRAPTASIWPKRNTPVTGG